MCSEFTPNGTALLITPFCRIRTLPEVAPGATVAITWVSFVARMPPIWSVQQRALP
jgi:hypothetical protein